MKAAVNALRYRPRAPTSWRSARFFEHANTGAGVNANRPQLTSTAAVNHTPQKYLAGSDGGTLVG